MTSVRSFTTRALALTAGVLLLGAVGGCAQRTTVGQADVPSWQATALPSDPKATLSGSGKLLDRNPAEVAHGTVAAGHYTITMTCEGNGKVYYELFAGGTSVGDATNACNGNKDRVDLNVPAGAITVKASSVDVPTLYAFSLAPKG